MYDKFNDVYRYVPLNGDIAGLCANTDTVADPFFSLVVSTEVRFVVQLNLRLTQPTQRDILYPAESTQYAPSHKVQFSLVTRLHFLNQVHLTASMFVDCLSYLRKQSQLLLSSNCLNSTMSSHNTVP